MKLPSLRGFASPGYSESLRSWLLVILFPATNFGTSSVILPKFLGTPATSAFPGKQFFCS
jgi:hypothetical protein